MRDPTTQTFADQERPKYQLRDPGVTSPGQTLPERKPFVQHDLPGDRSSSTSLHNAGNGRGLLSGAKTPEAWRGVAADIDRLPSPESPSPLEAVRQAATIVVPSDIFPVPCFAAPSRDRSETSSCMSSRQTSASLADSTDSLCSSWTPASVLANVGQRFNTYCPIHGPTPDSLELKREDNGTYPDEPLHSSPTEPSPELTWEPDPESVDDDPADEVWRRLEVKLGRRLRDTISDRGTWVAKAAKRRGSVGIQSAQWQRVDIDSTVEMRKSPSDFSVSAYLSDDEGTDFQCSSTALFDMSAPLVLSVSILAATPANTPCIRSDTLHRSKRVFRGERRNSQADTSMSSIQPDAATAIRSKSDPTSISPHAVERSGEYSGTMYRLDSHIVSALGALQGVVSSPDLDAALALAHVDSSDHEEDREVGGLGLGMEIDNDTVYTLRGFPSSRLRTRFALDRLPRRVPDSDGSARFRSAVTSVEQQCLVKDLDTGVLRALTLRKTGAT